MMRPRSFRWPVLFAVVVLVAACSSDGGASEDTAVPQSERTAATLQAELESAADALVDQWGSDRDAFFVVAWSLDAGYSAAQIIEAVPAHTLRRSRARLMAARTCSGAVPPGWFRAETEPSSVSTS